MERVGMQDAYAGRAVLRRAHPVQGAVHGYAWQASVEKAGGVVGTGVLAAVAPLLQQSSLWLSESQDKEADDKAGL
jgi:hypothetical protein